MCTIDDGADGLGGDAGREPVPRLSVREAVEPGRHTLSFSGELDLATRTLFDTAVARAERAEEAMLVLDLSAVSFMDSTGLHSVLAAKQACLREGGQFMLARASEPVQRLFELSGVLDELPVGEAVAA
jgi:anti-anti-sigma factor